MSKYKNAPRNNKRSPREYAQSMLGREDLRYINQLGLWSAFSSENSVRQFASLSKAERRQFFERYAQSMGDDSPARAQPTYSRDSDHQLFDLPQNASLEQIHQRYRELAFSFHPDRTDGDTQLMQDINEAYQRLQEQFR